VSSKVNAEIISVGSEILLGHIINTNSSYLSKKLSELGIDIFRQSVVGDNPRRLSWALKKSLDRSDIVITTGGLGPTVDDITVNAIAEATGRALVTNPKIVKSIKTFFKKRHIKMSSYVLRQARIPEGALAIENTVGTAPAILLDYRGKMIIALPGPPRELKPIFEAAVIPHLKKRYRTGFVIVTRTIRTVGQPESAINKKIRSFLAMPEPVTTGIYARPNEVDIKITAKSKNRKKAYFQIRKVERKILPRLGKIVYGFDDDTIEAAVGKTLLAQKKRCAIAESCTGGLIASRITNVPGSSRYFEMATVTYSNRSKIKVLGLKKVQFQKYGAVSRQVAAAMARGILRKSKADVALAVTGIAGPGGGTKKKPVGLVFIALAQKKGTRCEKHYFIGNRTDVKYQASTAALDLLRRALIQSKKHF